MNRSLDMRVSRNSLSMPIRAGLLALFLSQSIQAASPRDAESESQASILGSSMPFQGFIRNDGQWGTGACFVADFGDMVVRAEPGGVLLQRSSADSRLCVVRLGFDVCNLTSPIGEGLTSTDYHYLIGNNRQQWRKHVRSFDAIAYPDVAPGTELRFYRRDDHLEYDLRFSSSARVDDFLVRCEGIERLSIQADGGLRMDTPVGPIIEAAPIAWQANAEGELSSIACAFRIVDDRHFGIIVSQRTPGSSLIIDPGLTWASFLGGSGQDRAKRVSVLDDGRVLVLSQSASPNFPTTAGVYDATVGGADAAISCLSADGSQLLFSTFVGGSDLELPRGLAVGRDGSIAIGGATKSSDFPTLASSFDQSLGGDSDGFVAVLAADGSDLLFSTFLGGSGGCLEEVDGVAITSDGLLVAAGLTCDTAGGFPTTPSAFDTTPGGGIDAFVTWLDPALAGPAQLICSSYLGGVSSDKPFDLALGDNDEPILVGSTTSVDFPTTSGAYDSTPGGDFITCFSADGTSLQASTRFKGGTPVRSVVDGQTIVVVGMPGLALPVSANAFDQTWNGHLDGFVARFDDQVSQVLAATYLGGSLDDVARGLAVDANGDIIVVGSTESADFPTTPGAYDTSSPAGLTTSTVSRLSADLSQLRYSSYLGPALALSSWANDVAIADAADVVVVGEGAQSGFPVTPGAFDETFNGGDLFGADGYVARMLLKPLTWYSLGGAVPGSNGTPALAGSGDLIGGQPVMLALTSAKPSTPATLIVGVSLLNAPFKGGTLVPNPNLLLFGLPTNGHGALTLNATWPSGLPSGFSFYTQYWIPDAAAPAGLAASNGLAGTTP